MNKPLCNHIIATQPLPPINAYLKEYILAGNGVFLRAVRPELEALIPLVETEISGLPLVTPAVKLSYPQVPQSIVLKLWQHSILAQNKLGSPVEILFYLQWKSNHWQYTIPPQEQDITRCTPVDTGLGSDYAQACIELHSHHALTAQFSDEDDVAEQQFRIYAVLGEIFSGTPTLCVRVGIYGHHYLIPASWIFTLPSFIKDEYFS